MSEIPPKWVPIVEELSTLVANDDPRAHTVFATMATPLYRDIVRAELDALCADPNHGASNRRFAGTLWLLHTDAAITLSLSLVKEADTTLVSSIPQDLSIAAVGPSELTIEHYRIDVTAEERDMHGREHRLELQSRRDLREGEALHFRAGVDVLRFAACARPTPVLSLHSQPSKLRLTWDYDVTTLQPISCSLVDATDSQLVFLLGVVEAHQRVDHLGFVDKALRHSAHAVRWAAVKTLWRLDVDRALAATQASLDDAHPHVRRAAQRTLELFDSQRMKEAACR